jgi:hypothetical protein
LERGSQLQLDELDQHGGRSAVEIYGTQEEINEDTFEIAKNVGCRYPKASVID